MPKGQVTEEDLASGLKNLPGFGSLGGAQKLRRDSPFRDSLAQPKTIDLPAEATTSPAPPALMVAAPAEPVVSVPPVIQQIRPRATKEIKKVPVPLARAAENIGQRKADVFTERVTLPMSPEMRDQVDSLARDLQRSRTQKGERITAKSVMRVAIQILLQKLELKPGDAPNSEGEILELMIKRVSR